MIEKTRIMIVVFAFLSWLSTPISAVTQSFCVPAVNSREKENILSSGLGVRFRLA
jgi:hypothetical protein